MQPRFSTQALCRRLFAPISAALILVACVANPLPAHAQQAPSPDPMIQRMAKPVTFSMQHTTLGQVLDDLMKQINSSYTLDSRLVDDQIGAIRMEHVPFKTALEAALKAGLKPATYQFEAGVFRIVPREDQTSESVAPTSDSHRPTISTSASDPSNMLLSLDFQHASLTTVLKLMFDKTGLPYTLDPNLEDVSVTANLKNTPFRTALESVLKSTGKPISYRIENGIYSITAAPEPISLGGSAQVLTQGKTPDQDVIKMDIERGDLYTALKLLFQHAHQQFSLDPSLRNIPVTIHLEQPFNRALEALLRTAPANLQITYRVENGIYSITPKANATPGDLKP